MARAASRKRPRAALPWVQGLLCGVAAVAAGPTALLAAALLAPSAVMAMSGAEDAKPVARCMMLAGLAAAVFPLAALWSGGHTIDLSVSLLDDGGSLLTAWVAQAAGWLLVELLPVLIGAAQALQAKAQARALRAARTQLEEEWGIAPAAQPADALAEDRSTTAS